MQTKVFRYFNASKSENYLTHFSNQIEAIYKVMQVIRRIISSSSENNLVLF